MAFLQHYTRVTADNPCPICQRPDWCAVARDGRKVICSRVPSGKPAGDAGWIHYGHYLKAVPLKAEKPREYLSPEAVQAYIDGTIGSWHDDMFGRLCQLLKLHPLSVWKIGATYDAQKAVLAFPMFSAERKPVGVRFRRRDGKKWSLTGGREGVFMSADFNAQLWPVFVAEGPTDSAALIEAGLTNVLGRPNCSGGTTIIQGLLRDFPGTPTVVLADPDEPGLAGAERLVMSLPNPSIVLSGPSDVRSFVTKFPKRSDARDAIVKVLAGYRYGEWQEVCRNLSGQLFNFSSLCRKTA